MKPMKHLQDTREEESLGMPNGYIFQEMNVYIIYIYYIKETV